MHKTKQLQISTKQSQENREINNYHKINKPLLGGLGVPQYIFSRLLQLIPILIGITFLTFGMLKFSSTDVVDKMYEQSGTISEEVKAKKRAELGLDQPFLVQYGKWLKDVVSGNMGKSFVSDKSVLEIFLDKLPATLELMAISILLTIFISLPFGIISAINQNKFFDYIIRIFSFIGNSLPNFFVALLLIYFLALKLNLLPIMGSIYDWRSVIMPALTLTIAMSSKYIRQIRAVILEEINKPYVIGARSRGVKESTILIKSVLPSTFVTLTTLLALSIGSLLGGTAVVEIIFMWDGVGKMAVDAILMRDYPIIQAYVLWMSIIYVFVNFLADLLYYQLDPRVRLEKEKL